ncbi:hypothetical protein FA95DRAFT_1581066 [Auriscalpium vulgare]|uniref:Uncharacterized protein n=1 Tax=Auriscalpium vulgare TaxID=40419 RepID=A0ACB8S2X2_9AGAM|nr:hypothetical protein FA95DRAFT_1581066 [Auriscalpium vulgare]
MTQINYLLRASRGTLPGAAQRYCRGHVAIIPQESGRIASVLPPPLDDAEHAVCVVFLGGDDRPTLETIRNYHPLLVSIRRVSTMIKFLLEHNVYYRDQGIVFSDYNLSRLLEGGAASDGVGIPSSVEITHIPSGSATGAAASSGYDGGPMEDVEIPESDLYIQSVGYTSSSETSAVHSKMKAQALQWCLDRKPFVAVRRGSALFPDRDPRMLTFCFPNLDPYGMGAFNHPARLKNMVLTADAPFAKDPNLIATVWDAHQRLQTTTTTQFQLKSGSYADVVDVLRNSLPELEAMNKKWDANPQAKATSRKEKELMLAMNKLTVLSKNIMGSNGIRALLKSFGCPGLWPIIPSLLRGSSTL